MTLRNRIYIILVVVLFLVVATPYGVQRYRIARSAAFCDAVEALPSGELGQFASRCDHLMLDWSGAEGEMEIITDTNILAQFALAGRRPYEIVRGKDTVGIKWFKGGWRYSTLALWDEDNSSDGDLIRVLKITYGTFGWRVLCQRTNQNGSADDESPPAKPQAGAAP